MLRSNVLVVVEECPVRQVDKTLENSQYFIWESLIWITGLCMNMREDFNGYKFPSLALILHFIY